MMEAEPAPVLEGQQPLWDAGDCEICAGIDPDCAACEASQ